MKPVKALFVGIDHSNDRVWGYLGHGDIGFSSHKTYYTFWGKKNGKLYFQLVRNFFELNAAKQRKIRKYRPIQDTDIWVSDQFSQFILFKKLKDGS